MFIDTNSGSDNVNNDPTGIMVCTVANGKLYVVKFVEKWLQLYELVQEILELISVYSISKCYIENASAGKNVISELKRQLRGKTIVLGVNAGSKSKEERVNAIQPHLVNGKVVIVEDDWNTLYMNYLADFNHGKHDEAIDLTVYAVLTLIAGRRFSTAEEQQENNKGMASYDHDEIDLYS